MSETMSAIMFVVAKFFRNFFRSRARKLAELNAVPAAVIDPVGGRKFVVCELRLKGGGTKIVFRADETKDFHAQIVGTLRNELRWLNVEVRCLGGGRIDAHKEKIVIYGFSQQYGAEKERLTVTEPLLRAAFPELRIVASVL